MTKELLKEANALNSRITIARQLQDQIKNSLPIVIQCGMGQTVQFDIVRDKDNKLQQLDNGIYDALQQLLDGYVAALQKQFDILGE